MSALQAKEITEKILDSLGIAAVVEVESEEPVYLTISSDDSALLIGKKGDSLRALQSLVNTIYRRGNYEAGYVGLDIAGYKKERVEKVQAAAQEAADRARETNEPQHLKPMNSFERRAVHTQLANDPDIITESEGDGMSRHIVIKTR